MENKSTRKHTIFICLGFLLACLCMGLAFIPCIEYNALNGWTMERTTSYTGFFPITFLLIGAGEMTLLFYKNVFLRILAIVFTLIKLFAPWTLLQKMNEVGAATFDYNYCYTVYNYVPYILTALTVLLLIQHIIMLFVITGKKTSSLDSYS